MSFYGNGQEFSLLEDAIEAADMAWWLMELPSGTVFFGLNKIRMLGYNDKDAGKFVHYKSFTDLVHPDDYDRCMQAMTDLITGKTDMYDVHYRIRAVDGSYKVFLDRGKITGKRANGEMAISGIVTNITSSPYLKPT